jgi:phosphoglycolate phosphatase-like HAD superfamily hydrolase
MRGPVDQLPSWNDTPTRQAITEFVGRVTKDGASTFVPLEERVAVFDNDGTLWSEKPMPIQLGFILERLAEMAGEDPSLRDHQPWKAAYERDHAWLASVVEQHYAGDDRLVKVLFGGVLKAFGGMRVDDHVAGARRFVTQTHHPTLGRPYSACAFLPMVELLRYLEANGFTTVIASGGDRDFVRAITQEIYAIPPERVVGSSSALRWVEDEQGGSIVYLAQPDVFDDGPVKPIRIWSRLGRRPILAAGNSNGDVPMLAWAGGDKPALRVLVNHDDAEREFDYTAGAEAALRQAGAQGWTVISVKHDWATVYPT